MLSRTIRTALSALVFTLVTVATAPRVLAQHTVARVTIPFDFQYESAHLNAGPYTVSATSDHLMLLRGRPEAAFGTVQWTDDRQPSKTGKLVFRRYGDQYVLKEIWIANETSHARCPKSKVERRLEELARNAPAPTDVEVAVLDSPR